MSENNTCCELNISNQQCTFKLNNEKRGETNKFELEIKSDVLKLQDMQRVDIKCAPATAYNHVKQPAVRIRSACKSYGTNADPVVVLDELNMTVPKGIVYGLLGASGCGKTTLLSCILGLKKLNSGEITVLDRTVDSKSSGNLGRHVGYMPQEMSLYGDFTIRETLTFFGWIAGMTSKKIQQRMEFLMKLLGLLNVNQRVKNLSGGQQRRVSLATALLHEPELLILDEPTVGLDSVLRENIWNYFLDITKEGRTTVVITTHYIDETRRAHRIALMRKGHFLAEDAPNRLLIQYGLETLEALFYKLSYSQDTLANQDTVELTGGHKGEPSSSRVSTNINEEVREIDANIRSGSKTLSEKIFGGKSSDYLLYRRNHMKALLWKNLLWMIRHVPLMLGIVMAPFVTVALFCTCVGNDPVDIPMAFVNYETNNIMSCEDKLTCNSSQLSCYYLKFIEKHDIKLIPYDTESDARKSVEKGKTYASIAVKNNYSAALYSRVQDWQAPTSWAMMSSEIEVFRDISNNFVANYLKRVIYDSFQNFLRDYMESCDIKGKWIATPITWESPVYGRNDSSFSEFVISGLLLLYIAYLSSYVTVSIAMIERSEGLLERLLVIGTSRLELITSHLMCQFVIMILQSALSLISLFLIFNVTMEGSLLLIILLTLLTGLCGMFYGLCLSCACNNEQTAAYVIVGTGFPLMVLSGILWPLEGMHHFFKPLASVLPFTQAIESMRNVMLRGWGITTETVYMGFVSMTMWTVFFLVLSVIFVRFKKN